MVQTIETRLAVIDDIPALTQLLGVLFAQETEFKPAAELQAKGLTQIISGEAVGDIVVTSADGIVVGMVNLLYTVSTALGAPVAILEDMVVSPDMRGQNIGSTLIEFALGVARQRGCQRVSLLTDHDNSAAHRFYQKHGFVQSSMLTFRLNLEPES